jgi:hypothetical protein
VACPVRRACTAEMAAWQGYTSLAGELAQAWRATQTATHATEPADIFAAVWHAHYGFTPGENVRYTQQQRGFKALQTALPKAVTLCQEHDLDFGIFVTAQIHGFEAAKKKGWLKYAPKYMPMNWLSGPKALERYRTYGYVAKTLYNGVQAHTLDGRTPLGKLREALVHGMETVAEEYFYVWRTLGSADWTATIGATNPNKDWRAVYERGNAKLHGIRTHYRELRKVYGDEALDREQRLASLRVAHALAEQTQHGLADRIGITKWSWESFTRLLVRIAGPWPTETQRPTMAPQLGGALWGGHDPQPREGDVKRYGDN